MSVCSAYTRPWVCSPTLQQSLGSHESKTQGEPGPSPPGPSLPATNTEHPLQCLLGAVGTGSRVLTAVSLHISNKVSGSSAQPGATLLCVLFLQVGLAAPCPLDVCMVTMRCYCFEGRCPVCAPFLFTQGSGLSPAACSSVSRDAAVSPTWWARFHLPPLSFQAVV